MSGRRLTLAIHEKAEMDLENLIREIFTRQCLWNTSDKNYHNRILVDRMWAEISEKIEFPIDECKRKWKNLRDRFRIEMRKDVKKKTGTLISNWQYYNQLQFLKTVMGPSRNSGILPEVDNEISNHASIATQNDHIECFAVQRATTPTIQHFQETRNLRSLSSGKCRIRKVRRKKITEQKPSINQKQITKPKKKDALRTFGKYIECWV